MALGPDPIAEARVAERREVAFAASHQAALTDLNEARSAIRRPSRPWSPAWVPGLALTMALMVTAGMASANEASILPPAGTTTTAAAETAPVPETTTTTVDTLGRETATVASVTDGDTIRVVLADGTNEPVRLIGIDAPERGHDFSAESKALMVSLVEGETVYLVSDVSNRDRFDRLLRYVYVGETFINEEMVESGLAVAREYPPDIAQADVLEAAQERAADGDRGPWGTTTTTAAPTTTTTPPTTTTVAPTTTTTLAPTTTTTLTPTTTAAPPTTAAPTTTAPPASNCHPSYGGCLLVGQGDYDCAGGSGNGPNYVNGPVSVVGYDDFDLDRDGDGVGCE